MNEEEEGTLETLSAEATVVNFNFTQQVVATGVRVLGEPEPLDVQ